MQATAQQTDPYGRPVSNYGADPYARPQERYERKNSWLDYNWTRCVKSRCDAIKDFLISERNNKFTSANSRLAQPKHNVNISTVTNHIIDRWSYSYTCLIYRSFSCFIRHAPEPAAPQISEQEFEEIFQRNKTVMSSAISRAVQDAGAGNYDLVFPGSTFVWCIRIRNIGPVTFCEYTILHTLRQWFEAGSTWYTCIDFACLYLSNINKQSIS